MDLRTSTISTTSDVISESYMSTSKSTDFIKPKDDKDNFLASSGGGGVVSTSNGEGNPRRYEKATIPL